MEAVIGAVVVAPDGEQFLAFGLLTEVLETILQFIAPTTKILYTLKWKLFYFLVGTATSRASQLRSWYSSGVSAGAFPCRVFSLHSEGLRGSLSCLLLPSGWSIIEEAPASYTFPPWHPEAEPRIAHQNALVGHGSGSGGFVQCYL